MTDQLALLLLLLDLIRLLAVWILLLLLAWLLLVGVLLIGLLIHLEAPSVKTTSLNDLPCLQDGRRPGLEL